MYAGKNILFSPERGMLLSGEEQECNIANQVWMVLAHVMNVEENRTIMTRAVKGAVPVKGISAPYMYHHVTEALFEAGLKEEGNPSFKIILGRNASSGSCTPVYLIHKYLL